MTKKILVAIDLEDTTMTERTLGIASELANLHGARVSLVYVATDLPPLVATHLPDDFESQNVTALSKQLKVLTKRFDLSSGQAKVFVRFGPIYREILSQARSDSADLIVIGCHKPGVTDFLLGSNAARVARHATCSVYVVR